MALRSLACGLGIVVVLVNALPSLTTKPGCGDINVIFTGLPPYHPLVVGQGFDPALVDEGLRKDAANIIKAGYNSRVVLMGPEQPISVLSEQMDGISWDATGVGFGVRGSNRTDLTLRLEDIIQLYREKAPSGYVLFDHSYDSALWAIEEQFPLSKDCVDTPGTDLGFEVFCDICSQ